MRAVVKTLKFQDIHFIATDLKTRHQETHWMTTVVLTPLSSDAIAHCLTVAKNQNLFFISFTDFLFLDTVPH